MCCTTQNKPTMLAINAAATLATALVFAPHVSAVLQYLINPVTAATLFIGGRETLDNAVLAALWTAADGGIGIPITAWVAVWWSRPFHALVLAVPLARLLFVSISPGLARRSRCSVTVASFAACIAVGLACAVLALGLDEGDDSAWSHAGAEARAFPWLGRPAGGGALLSAALLQPGWYIRSLAFLRHASYFDVILVAQPLLYAVPLTLRFW